MFMDGLYGLINSHKGQNKYEDDNIILNQYKGQNKYLEVKAGWNISTPPRYQTPERDVLRLEASPTENNIILVLRLERE